VLGRTNSKEDNLFEKLKVNKHVKAFAEFYETTKFITMFLKVTAQPDGSSPQLKLDLYIVNFNVIVLRPGLRIYLFRYPISHIIRISQCLMKAICFPHSNFLDDIQRREGTMPFTVKHFYSSVDVYNFLH
jgi:hypothetical protein